jgi:cobyrinic acid a,c-diamide synthase
VLAECGGLLYLARELVDLDGRAHPMCGVIPARGVLGGRLKALGYRTVRAREDLFLLASGQELRGHEFHYGALEGERSGRWRSAFDWEGARGSLGQEGWWNGSVLATWFHGWLDHQDVVARWIDAMRRARGKEEGWK